jgi:hypothetical protein
MPNKREAIERVAELFHEAMVHAVKEFKGEPQPWKNGNSTAESYARRQAEAALSALDMGVSEEMIEAGREAYGRFVSPLDDTDDEMLTAVFLAMQAARLTGLAERG